MLEKVVGIKVRLQSAVHRLHTFVSIHLAQIKRNRLVLAVK